MAIYTNFYGTEANEKFDLAGFDLDRSVHVEGAGGNDYITATELRDFLIGDAGDDVILGGAGGDAIFGDTTPNGDGGDDQLHGGTGDDTVFGGGGRDYINAGDDNDLVDGGDGDDFIVGGLGADEIYGSAGNDIIFGNGIPDGEALPLLATIAVDVDGVREEPLDPAEQFGGNLGELPLVDDDATDVAYGGSGRDLIFGLGGADQLFGGKGGDLLLGGLGNDELDGGRGADFFAYSEYGAGNADHISGFQKKDGFYLDADVFLGIGAAGETLAKKYFHEGTEAEGKNDKIIYDKASGTIYYDQDGSGGTYDIQEIASIHAGFKLKAAYFDLF